MATSFKIWFVFSVLISLAISAIVESEPEEIVFKNEISDDFKLDDIDDGAEVYIERDEEDDVQIADEDREMETDMNSIVVKTRNPTDDADFSSDLANCRDNIDCKIKLVEENIEMFLDKGFELAEERLMMEKDAARARLRRGEQISKHAWAQFQVKRSTAMGKKLSSCQGTAMLETAKLVTRSLNLTAIETSNVLKKIKIPRQFCQRTTSACTEDEARSIRNTPFCADYYRGNGPPEYRTADGTCNNKAYPTWGATNILFRRLAPSDYEDGISAIRSRGIGGQPLRNCREISVAISSALPQRKSNKMTQMVKQWGQFIDHDMVLTPETSVPDHTGDGLPDPLPCCEHGIINANEIANSDCQPIYTTGDPFYNSEGIECLKFARSMQADPGCGLPQREQFNAVSAFLDGTMIYGETEAKSQFLRSNVGGKLRESTRTEAGVCQLRCKNHFLPEAPNSNDKNLFVAGDIRVNEQPALTAMHTIWMRYHNRIAHSLDEISKKYGKNWDDERLYQESRRLIGALIQHITYKEFLPMVLSPSIMGKYNLYPLDYGYVHSYNPSLDPSHVNVFATAAFRFGHSLISNTLKAQNTEIPLCDHFFNNRFLYDDTTEVSHVIGGEFEVPSEMIDAVMVSTLTGRLFTEGCQKAGLDLYALNCQRGRDHGLPSFNEFRASCGLPRFTSFSGFGAAGSVLSQVYDSVQDVDVFVGGMAEPPISGGFLGETFSNILGKQFHLLKFGDRFYYENDLPEMKFTLEQLDVIRKCKFASIICSTTSLDTVPSIPMEMDGYGTDSCRQHRRFSLSDRVKYYWVNEP